VRYLRYLLVGLGVVVFGAAAFIALAAGVGEVLIEPLLAAAGNDYVLVAVFGGVALVMTILGLVVRSFRGLDQTTAPDPTEVRTAPRPGVEFDRTVEEGLSLWLSNGEADRVRERLREAAIRVEMRANGVSRRRARDAVESGAWTDDEAATAFLGTDGHAPGWRVRVRAAARGESWFQFGSRRTARAIARGADWGENR